MVREQNEFVRGNLFAVVVESPDGISEVDVSLVECVVDDEWLSEWQAGCGVDVLDVGFATAVERFGVVIDPVVDWEDVDGHLRSWYQGVWGKRKKASENTGLGESVRGPALSARVFVHHSLSDNKCDVGNSFSKAGIVLDGNGRELFED